MLCFDPRLRHRKHLVVIGEHHGLALKTSLGLEGEVSLKTAAHLTSFEKYVILVAALKEYIILFTS